MRRSGLTLTALLAGAVSLSAAQARPVEPPQRSSDGVWERVAESALPAASGARLIVPDVYKTFQLDAEGLRAILESAPPEDGSAVPGGAHAAVGPDASVVLNVPMPDGGFARFAVKNSPVMEPALAAQFPDIQTFVGQGLDDPTATGRFDWTQFGFHGMILSARGTIYIDPYRRGDVEHYIAYFKKDYSRSGTMRCLDDSDVSAGGVGFPGASDRTGAVSATASVGPTLRTFRLAMAATGEYTQFHGGTVPAGMAAVTTTVNRVTGVYERELAIRLVLVGNNSSIIYTNPGGDPYTNNSPGTLLNENQANLDATIMSPNYDIGHVVGTGGGGVATLGVVCRAGLKARGETGSPAPVGDAFDIDFVAHEMGHQFGATHSFNGTSGNCGGGNRTGSTAYEVGSGSTIMAYAGICPGEDLQTHSDDYFHTISFDQISDYVTIGSGTCSAPTGTGNTAPTVEAGANYTIPMNTPFALTATASDPGDALTYCWEEFDLGNPGPPNTDDGTRPIFRSFDPVTSPTRTFPKLVDVLNNVTNFGESYPTTSRTMTYRVTARDNRTGGGGVNYDFMTVTSTSSAGPFTVTQPNTNVNWTGNSTRTVTWNVAGTSGAPVGAVNVKISLSLDGGNTFPTVLAASTPNDGTQDVLIPNTPSTTARVKIEGVGNVFFDVSNVNFTLSQDPSVPLMAMGPVTAVPAGGDMDAYIESGEGGKLTIQINNNGSVGATNVRGTLTTSTPGVVIVTTSQNPYPDIPTMGSGSNASPFVFGLASTFPCGGTVNFNLNVQFNPGGGSTNIPFSIATGEPTVSTYSYTTPPVAIPDNFPSGVDVPITVSGFSGTIPDIDFSFDGTSCSPAAGSTTGGLSHLQVGDLVVKLRSPLGTTVTLMDRPGGNGNDGNHFCQTRLNDAAVNAIQGIINTQAPFSGQWRPANPLSAFNGQNPNGTWTLNVSDNAVSNTGTVRRFSLIINGLQCNAGTSLPGDVGTGAPPTQLKVTKPGGNIKLVWGPSCSPSAIDYAIYEGTLGTWYSHNARFCTTQGALEKTLVPLAGNRRYWLVVPLTADREGSYGRRSNGAERPVGGAPCRTQLLGPCP